MLHSLPYTAIPLLRSRIFLQLHAVERPFCKCSDSSPFVSSGRAPRAEPEQEDEDGQSRHKRVRFQNTSNTIVLVLEESSEFN